MKAAVRFTYGHGDVLSLQEIEKPTPLDDELLVRVYATTVSRTDCHILWGKPFFMRFFTGLFKPNLKVTGTDFAGQVEATGKNTTTFQVGDKVMGFDFLGLKSHAQYLTVQETKVNTMPQNVTYDQAAACVEGAFYALNVINIMKPKPGQKALVYGATGAIGSSMVQFFKFYGTYVTAVCGGENRELVQSLGADKVIDYKTEDFAKDKEQYDFAIDAVDKVTFGQCKPLLAKNGLYSSSGGPNFLQLLLTSVVGGKRVVFAPPKDLKECLAFIRDLVEKGNFKPVVDRKYSLDKIAQAFEYVGSGEKIGNVIITTDV